MISEEKFKEIYEKNKQHFDEIDYYDNTRIALWEKSGISVYLKNRTIKRLKELSKKTGKPVSHIIEEAFLHLK